MRDREVRAVIVLGAAAVISGLGIAAWLFLGAQGFTPEEAARLIELETTGLGYLEAGRYAESDRAFTEIAERLPEDPLGARNLTVSRLLALKAAPTEQRQAALQQVTAALDLLREVEPDSFITHLLVARFAQSSGDDVQAFEALTRAIEFSPHDAGLWYELYTLGRGAEEPSRHERAHDALRRAHELSPDNLFVLTDWLRAQAERQDPAIAATLAKAREILAPFIESIRNHTRVDLAALIGEASQAIGSKQQTDWSTVSRNVLIIANVLRPEVAVRRDHKRLLRPELQYTLVSFGRDFLEQLQAHQPERLPAVAVSLEPASDNDQFPALTSVHAATLTDFDLDGRLDLLVARGSRLEVYTRTEMGWALASDISLPTVTNGIVVADLDRDSGEAAPLPGSCRTADQDLIVFGAGGVTVLENRLDAATETRTLVPTSQDLPFQALRGVLAVTVADLDHDGDLDLVVSSEAGLSLWSNRGELRFTDISARSALPPMDLKATALIAVDWNRTVDIDLLLAGPGGAGLLENLRHGRFRWRSLDADSEILADARTLTAGDFDGNVSWDVISAGKQGIGITLTQTLDTGLVRELAAKRLAKTEAQGLATWDFDNDGYLDLLAWGGQGLAAWRGGPGAEFASAETLFAIDPAPVSYAEPADIDGDGDLDVLVLKARRVMWYSNRGGNLNHWIDIALSGQQSAAQKDERVNIHGIGSMLEVKAGQLYQARVVATPVTHFGLGRRLHADVARVLWTNGIPQNEIRPAADTPICEVQILKGSCPYLYTWTGSRFEFLTDLLWASPIGLQLAENVLAPAREWEYLKIPGERLVSQNGEYQLQVTEELWEAAYFDRVSLIAVDHPAGVAIYSNEKVGPAEIAAFQVHTVRHPRAPVAATDQRGRDVHDLIVHRDGRYLKAFTSRKLQGLVDAHYLELNLGALEHPDRITLFLTGWVFPTDTSLNIAVSQNPVLEAPKPPSLWVPDGAGDWQQVRSYIGFPGGKTKTIAIDLSNTFLAEDYRLRIATSMEIYWDQVFFTVDEVPAETRLTELPLVGATLHYRGFSKRIDTSGHGPESYDYTRVKTGPQWPPMQGHFTRYGNVLHLVEAADDRLVVMGAGDELTLRFKVPANALPPGWERDFIVHNIGWDKDADLNTVYGETVEPRPFSNMRHYPDPAYPRSPHTARVLGQVATFESRTQPIRAFWHMIKDF